MTTAAPSHRSRWRQALTGVCLSAMVWALAVGPAAAQPTDAPRTLAARLSPQDALAQARSQLDGIQKALIDSAGEAANSDKLSGWRATALAAKAVGESAATDLAPGLADVQARLAQLGTLTAGAKEMPDVAAERAELQKSSSALDAQIKLARLLAVDAEQTVAQVATRRRQQFQAQLGERTSSILGTQFWSEVSEDLPRDAGRLATVLREAATLEAAAPAWVLASLLVLLGAVAGLRVGVGRWLMALTATQVPPSRLRRSLHAVTVVLLSVTTAALATAALGWPLLGASPAAGLLASALPLMFGGVCFGAYISGLGKALLCPTQPSWRLTSVPDAVARGLRWFPLQMGVLIAAVWVTEGLASLLNISLASTVALNCITSLAMGLSMAMAIMRGESLRREAERDPDHPAPPRAMWLMLLVSAGWLVLAGSLVALLAGYVAFGSFVIRQVTWALTVLGSAYLLMALVEDSITTLLAPSPPTTAGSTSDEPQGYRLGEQAAVLLSGLSRLVISLIAFMLLLAPFGEGPAELFRRTDQLQSGLNIGQVHILPGAVLQALLVLALSVAAVKVLQRWLQQHYLPTTRLDPGMQSSATTLLGYVGYVCAVSLALSAVGMGLDRIAWVASALSVGIGFGLQAVVQNFVSGLILLAERPVKVGDWVSLGTVEGDIRRINMRATEIQLGDCSTVIVPNSEFITKTVRNVTHANPLGRVQIKLPMPLSTPADTVRTLLMAVLQDNPDLLKTPAPEVQLDGIENGHLVFNATGYVNSPRAAYGVRSALLFEALKRLADAQIDMAPPPQIITLPMAATGPEPTPSPLPGALP
ncbi:MAG: DUF3772 domain-containing protein [Polaromonas sp.]